MVTKLTKSVFSFPATPKGNWNVFGGVIEVQKFITPGGGGELHSWNNGSERLFMLYLIIVFNNVFGFFIKDMDLQGI